MRVTLTTLALSLGLSLYSSAQTLLIADKVGNRLLYFDTETAKVTRSVPVGRNPHEVVVTLDGRLAFTANSRSNTVSVVELEAGKEIKRLESPFFRYPHGMAVHPDGKILYLTSEQKQLLLLIDIGKLEVAGNVPTGMEGSHMVVLSPQGERAYLTNRESASVTMLKTDESKALRHSPAGNGAEGIALSPDGRWLFVANRNDNDVHIFDASTLALDAKVAVAEGPVRVACSPDGRWVLVSHRASHQVHVLDLAQREIKARIPVGKEPGGMAFSADGAKAYVANTGEGSLSVLDMKALKVEATYPAGEGPDGMILVSLSDR